MPQAYPLPGITNDWLIRLAAPAGLALGLPHASRVAGSGAYPVREPALGQGGPVSL